MEQSLFLQWVAKYFPGIVVRVTETLNDTKVGPSYLHMTMLREDLSTDGKWESVSAQNTLVAADIVAMDSPLPLKARDSVSKYNGDIPKLGMKLQLNEKQLTDLDTLVSSGATDAQIVGKLFADIPRVIGGVKERLEEMFLRGLSTGAALIEDSENVGTGIRVNYGFPVANKFGVSVLWTNPTTAKPFDDIKRVLEKAKEDGNVIIQVLTDPDTIDNMCASTQAKELYAFSQNFVGSNIPALDLDQLNQLVNKRYKFTFAVVDRSIRYEKNGNRAAVKPWQAGMLTFVCSPQVGTLVYATLAEERHPVASVTYQKSGNFTLVSKYRQNDPLSEFTSSQARAVPVISNVDEIYQIDSTQLQA